MLARITYLIAALLAFACTTGSRPAAPAGDSRVTSSPAGDGQVTDSPPLILLSMDGFRWDYLDRVETPNLDRLIARGVRAESLIPPFPSRTFPSHYTIVTGLHVGHHGILSNIIRDPRWPEVFRMPDRAQVQNARWWQGEPIWVTAERQGRKAAVCFWPGSEAPIKGVRPSDWSPFDVSMPFEARVDRVLSWLDRPAAQRPALMITYFEEPNRSGHRYGALAAETMAAVRRVDAMFGRLLDGLEQRQLASAVNIVVVSDHGMTDIDPQHVIRIDELAKLEDGEVLDQGAILQIFTASDERTEALYKELHGAHAHLSVYRRQDVPERFHIDHPRLPDILGVPDVGWEVLTTRLLDRLGGRVIKGDHGHDPEHPDMQGIFFAAGPSFVSGARVPALKAVDVYNILAQALNLEPAPNDGDPQRLSGITTKGAVK